MQYTKSVYKLGVSMDQILNKVIDYQSKADKFQNLSDKFTISFLLSIIEKEKIYELEKKMINFDKRGIDVVDFVKVFLELIEYSDEELIYLAIGLVDFFKAISEKYSMITFIKYSDITNYICDVHSYSSFTTKSTSTTTPSTRKACLPKRSSS